MAGGFATSAFKSAKATAQVIAGQGLTSNDNNINVNVDNSTLKINSSNEVYVASSSSFSPDTSYTWTAAQTFNDAITGYTFQANSSTPRFQFIPSEFGTGTGTAAAIDRYGNFVLGSGFGVNNQWVVDNVNGTNGAAYFAINGGSKTTPTSNILFFISVGNGAIFTSNNTLDNGSGSMSIAGTFNINASSTTLSGTTSGSAIYVMPEQGSAYKKFIVYLDAYENTSTTAQTISFATSFSYTPEVSANGTGTTVSVSTSELTLPASMSAAASGFIIVEGF